MGTEGQPNGIEGLQAPRIKILENCDFPIIERDIEGYKVLVIPKYLQDIFDKEGYAAIRINSTELAEKFPIFGGKTALGYSLLPHQDHNPRDVKRFIALSKNTAKERGSTTYITNPVAVQKALPKMIGYLNSHLDELKKSFVYDPSSQLSKEELLSCFEPGGLDILAEKKIAGNTDPNIRLFVYTGILGYIIQNGHSEALVKEFLTNNEKEIVTEDWKNNGTLIIDNPHFFHGRLGPNNPLQRNLLVTE